MSAVEDSNAKTRVRRPRPEMVIEYLKYAVADVRALSPHSTKLLEDAIAVLVEDTARKAENGHDAKQSENGHELR
jgi:hypothetical protein